MRNALLLLVATASLLGQVSMAQPSPNCEHPIKDLASCPPCPSSTDLCRKPVDGYQPTVNGCGPEKFSNLIHLGVIPQGYGNADFANGGCPSTQSCGCNQHDRCYGTCNNDKKACDDALLQELRTSCRNTYPVDPRGRDGCSDGLCFSDNQRLGICLARARKYYQAVAGLGQGAYDDAQKDACQCCCKSPGVALRASAQLLPANQTGPVCAPETWSGMASEQADLNDGQGNTLHRHQSATVTWTPMPQDPSGTVFTASGTVLVSATGTAGPCSITLPPTTFSIGGTLQFFPSSTPVTYMADGEPSGVNCLEYVYACPDGTTTLCGDPKPWLEVSGQSVPSNGDTISGTSTQGGITYQWSFQRNP